MPILGTSPDAIDLGEDRDRFKALVDRLGLKQPESGIAAPRRGAQRRRHARVPGDDPPVVCAGRPGHGDRRRRAEIDRYVARLSATLDQPSELVVSQKRPLLIDRYLAGCHRGRCRLPLRRPRHLRRRHHGAHRGSRHPFRRQRMLAAASLAGVLDPRAPGEADPRPGLGPQRGGADERAVRGQGPGDLHPRGQPARLAHRCRSSPGDRQADRRHCRAHHERRGAASFKLQASKLDHVAVKEAVFPFARFPGVDTILGPGCAPPAR